jgi:pyruvate kinase
MKNTDEMINEVDKMLTRLKYVKKGDTVVIVASHSLFLTGKTNIMKLHIIGEGLN